MLRRESVLNQTPQTNHPFRGGTGFYQSLNLLLLTALFSGWFHGEEIIENNSSLFYHFALRDILENEIDFVAQVDKDHRVALNFPGQNLP